MPSSTQPIAPGLTPAQRSTDPSFEQESFHRPRWLREEKELNAFEAIGMSSASVRNLTDRHEKADVELDRMVGGEDCAAYDLEGRVP